VLYQISTNGGSTWNTTTASQTALPVGSYQYRAIATDAAGNSSTTAAVSTTVLDGVAPLAPVLTLVADNVDPLQGSLTNGGATNDTTPTLTITAEAGSTVRVYDGSTELGVATETATAGTFTYTPTALGAGSHSLTVTATDAAGNVSNASTPFVVTVDTVAPNAGTLAITNQADIYDNAFNLSLTGQEAASAVVYQVSTNGGATWSTTTTAQSNLGLGSYQYRAIVTDAAGNTSTTAVVTTTLRRHNR
jgi:hypothetical protein